MPIIVVCPGCSTKLSAPEEGAGKQVRCPKCGSAADVPAFVAVEEVPVVEAAVVSPKPRPKPAKVDEDEDEAPRKKKRRDEEAEEDEQPRKKKKRAYVDDDDDDYEHDHPRRRRRQSAGGGGAGIIIAISLGAVLVLGGIGFAIWAIAGKSSPFAKKTPVPEGWSQHAYPDDGFKAYFPNAPTRLSMPVGGFGGMDGFNPGAGGKFGMGGFQAGNEMQDAESFSLYSCGNFRDQVHIELWAIRFRNGVPASVRNQIRNLPSGKFGGAETRTVKWLGYDAVEQTHQNGVLRIVYTDKHLIMASIGGPNNGRAKPEEEVGFFENFELTR